MLIPNLHSKVMGFDMFWSIPISIGWHRANSQQHTVQKQYRITATKWIQLGYKIPPAQLHPNKGHNWPYIYIYYKWCTVYNLYSLFIIYIIHVGFHKTIESPFHILPSWPPSSSEPTGLFVFPFEISDGSISGRHLAHRCGFSTKSWEQKIARWCCVYILYTLVLMRRHHVQTKST